MNALMEWARAIQGWLGPGWVDFILGAAKAFAVVMFSMNVGVLLTWVDRRQGAMMQDRVGPNRAVIWVPRSVALVAVLAPAFLVSLGAVAFALSIRGSAPPAVGAPISFGWALFFSHLAVFMLWVTCLVIAGRVRSRGVSRVAGQGLVRALRVWQRNIDLFIEWIGDPRRIVYTGWGAHAALLLVAILLQRSPLSTYLRGIGYGSGTFIFVTAVLFGALYSAVSLLTEQAVGLRLAGLLHPLADGLKTLFKEDFVPPRADKLLHGLAPFIAFFPALVLLAVVPFGDTLCFGQTAGGGVDLLNPLDRVAAEGVCAGAGAVSLQVVDLDIGILYVFAVGGTGIIGAALAGWSSDNKYSLLGGLRAASQMVSYEVALGLTTVGALMVYASLRLGDMVAWQANHAWGIFVQPLAFVLFLTAAIAESKRIPFDLPEGESELVAGYYTEYAGMKFAMFFFSEYIAVVSIAALGTTLFLGGWHIPFLDRDGLRVAIGDTVWWQAGLGHLLVVALGVMAFVAKTLLLCWAQLVVRWTLPRFRYDQLMRLGWQILLPLSLLNVLATGLVMLAIDHGGPEVWQGLRVAGDLTMALVVLAVLAAVLALVAYWLKPADRSRAPSTSAVRFAAALGGTQPTRMGN